MATKKAKKPVRRVKGTLNFSEHNGMYFAIVDEREENEGPEHALEWTTGNPLTFANCLRRAADWLEKHADKTIIVDID
jgi:hypothetical protein